MQEHLVNFFHYPSCGQYQHSKWQDNEETQHTGYYADQYPDRVQHPSVELVFRIELISLFAHSHHIIAQATYLSMGDFWKITHRAETLCVRMEFRILP